MATLDVENVPDELYAALCKRAAEEHRSVAQQLVHLLEVALAPHRRRSILELRGLGRDLWIGVDANEHVRVEREGWGRNPARR